MDSRSRWSLLAPSQSIGNSYVVEDFIGSGYEGEVYKIREIGTGIKRAAKLYYPKRNPHGKTVRSNVRKLRKLDHIDSILRFHHKDIIEIHGRKFELMISDLAKGKLLSTLLLEQKGKRFSDFEAIRLLRAIANSVAPIHLASEYHGDLHTKNIIVRRRGINFDVKLLDFFDSGRPTRKRIEQDVIDMISILYQLIGGHPHYTNASPAVKSIIKGRKHYLVLRNCRNAGGLVRLIDSLDCT